MELAPFAVESLPVVLAADLLDSSAVVVALVADSSAVALAGLVVVGCPPDLLACCQSNQY